MGPAGDLNIVLARTVARREAGRMLMRRVFALVLFALVATPACAATLLPPAETCFSDANGAPLGGGSVGFYIPSTLTAKDTWQDSAQTVLNVNPVLLNSAGCAVIYGSGVYRQIVKSVNGNTIWDQLTADTSFAQGGPVGFTAPGGRLTLQSGQPVLATDVVSGTVYYTPYKGNAIQVWNGQVLVSYAFAELVQALDANTGDSGYHAIGKVFDEFVIADTGGVLRLCSGPAWTTSTARLVGLDRTAAGNLANGTAISCRYGSATGSVVTVAQDYGTYVGSFLATTTGFTAMVMHPTPASGGPQATLALWNCYNRVLMTAVVTDSGAPYAYSSATIRSARGSPGNLITFLTGLQEDNIVAAYYQRVDMPAGGGLGAYGVGVDTTSGYYSGIFGMTASGTSLAVEATTITYTIGAQFGYHTLFGLENADGSHAASYDTNQNASLQLAELM